jgi:hypothetical protein
MAADVYIAKAYSQYFSQCKMFAIPALAAVI